MHIIFNVNCECFKEKRQIDSFCFVICIHVRFIYGMWYELCGMWRLFLWICLLYKDCLGRDVYEERGKSMAFKLPPCADIFQPHWIFVWLVELLVRCHTYHVIMSHRSNYATKHCGFPGAIILCEHNEELCRSPREHRGISNRTTRPWARLARYPLWFLLDLQRTSDLEVDSPLF